VLPGPGVVVKAAETPFSPKTPTPKQGLEPCRNRMDPLWTTLRVVAAAVGGIALALRFNQSKWLD